MESVQQGPIIILTFVISIRVLVTTIFTKSYYYSRSSLITKVFLGPLSYPKSCQILHAHQDWWKSGLAFGYKSRLYLHLDTIVVPAFPFFRKMFAPFPVTCLWSRGRGRIWKSQSAGIRITLIQSRKKGEAGTTIVSKCRYNLDGGCLCVQIVKSSEANL